MATKTTTRHRRYTRYRRPRWYRGYKPAAAPPTQIYTDSQAVITHITTGVCKARTKHIDACYHNSHDLHQRKVVKYDYVNTTENPANILTKALAGDRHGKFARAMGVW